MGWAFVPSIFLVTLLFLHLGSPFPTEEEGRALEKRDVSQEKRSGSGSSSSSSDGKKTIHVAGLFQLDNTHPEWWKHAQGLPTIIEATFDEINNDPTILPNHKLKLVTRDTRGEEGRALTELHKMLNMKKKFPVVMGPARSTVARATGQMMQHLNVVQNNFATCSAVVLDRVNYPNAYSTNFLNSAFNPVKIGILDHFGWTKASTVTLYDNVHYSETTDLHKRLRASGYGLVSGSVLDQLDDNPDKSASRIIQTIVSLDPEVIFLSTNAQFLAIFMCEVHKLGVADSSSSSSVRRNIRSDGEDGINIVVTGQAMSDDWQQEYAHHTTCTESELREVSDGILGVDHLSLREDGGTSVSGKTAADFDAWAQSLSLPPGTQLPVDAPFAYDAAYAVALALDGAINAGVDVTKFNYDRADIGDAIKTQMDNVNFQGITGPISYSSGGTRLGLVYVFRVDGYSNSRQRLAVYDEATGTFTWN